MVLCSLEFTSFQPEVNSSANSTFKPVSLALNRNVINLSSFSFDQHVFSLLEKGLNFALAPRKIPIHDIICDIE